MATFDKVQMRQEALRAFEYTTEVLRKWPWPTAQSVGHAQRKKDFSELLKSVLDSWDEPWIVARRHSSACRDLVKQCIHFRNKVAHQHCDSVSTVDGLPNLWKLWSQLNIPPPPECQLHILACRSCGQNLTRSAESPVRRRNTGGVWMSVFRSHEVQHEAIAYIPGDYADRNNAWQTGYVWLFARCSRCDALVGFRHDWAPEYLINLTTHTIRYDSSFKVMVVIAPDGSRRDLLSVVSDGCVRHHFYTFNGDAVVASPQAVEVAEAPPPVAAAARPGNTTGYG